MSNMKMKLRSWWKTILDRWNNYRYRFLPWIIVNLKNRQTRKVYAQSSDKLITDARALDILKTYFKEISKHSMAVSKEDIMRKTLGFSIKRFPSQVSGTGVFISSGNTKKGDVVSIYPGTVYQVHEPIFFQSIANPFIFRCVDGVLIDGNDSGLSRIIYKSCCHRDMIGQYFTCDMTWLTSTPSNHLSLGQYVNNATGKFPANVTYQELDIPSNFPLVYMKYLPNANYGHKYFKDDVLHVRTVVLIAIRDIFEGEELFSSYFTVVHKKEHNNEVYRKL